VVASLDPKRWMDQRRRCWNAKQGYLMRIRLCTSGAEAYCHQLATRVEDFRQLASRELMNPAFDYDTRVEYAVDPTVVL
jgi:hypothetical protein